MNYISIRYGSDWEPEFDQDGDYGTVIPSSESGVNESTHVVEKYMIGGPLCDPVVTGDVETAVETLRNQYSRIKTGADLNRLFEVLDGHRTNIYTTDEYRETLPDIDDLPTDLFDEDVDTSIPIQSVSGIGDKTIKRFASRFGVYSNLRTADREDFSGLLPGYSNNPDLDKMNNIITTLTEHYLDLSERPDWSGPKIDVDQFSDYPAGNPTYHGAI